MNRERREYLLRLANQPRVITTKEEAVRDRYRKYFTGKPCKKGHIDFRYVKRGNCVGCNKR